MVMRQISPVVEIIFGLYISVAYFAVLNVVTGTFCQSAMSAAEKDPALIAENLMQFKVEDHEQMDRLFAMIDVDERGFISYGELRSKLEDVDVCATFEALGLRVQDAWSLFRLMDAEEKDVIEIQDFMDACQRLKGGASTLHIATLTYQMEWMMERVGLLVTEQQKEIARVAAQQKEIAMVAARQKQIVQIARVASARSLPTEAMPEFTTQAEFDVSSGRAPEKPTAADSEVWAQPKLQSPPQPLVEREFSRTLEL